MTDAHHQDHKVALLPFVNHAVVAHTQAAQALGSEARALAAEGLIRSEQRTTHLGPIEHRVGKIFQGCHAAAQILDVIEVVLDRLANDVDPTAVELLSCRIELCSEGIGQPGRDLNHGETPLQNSAAKLREVTEMSVTLF